VFKKKDNRGGRREGSGRHKRLISGQTKINFRPAAGTSDQTQTPVLSSNVRMTAERVADPAEQENREENINISGNDTVNNTEESPEESETRWRTGQPEPAPVLDLTEDVLENEESMNELEEDSPIKEYLSKVLQDVKSQTNKDTENPKCYNEGTFWIRPRDPIFRHIGKPIEYSLPKVFVWLPYFLLPEKKLKCINCKETANVNVKEWCFPRRVIDLEDPYYILSKRFKCNACNGTASVFNLYIVTFNATSAQSIALLPDYNFLLYCPINLDWI
jgi:hypothetical protein